MPGFNARREEDGSVLILALIFILLTSLVLVPLAGFGTTALSNTANLNRQLSLEYAADGATEAAVQFVRYAPTTYLTTANCLPGAVISLTASAPSMETYCSGTSDNESAQTRVVTFSTCLAGESQSLCLAGPLLQAVVAFDDFSSTNVIDCTALPVVTTTCGTAMTINGWVVESANH